MTKIFLRSFIFYFFLAIVLFIPVNSVFAQNFNGGLLGGVVASQVSGDRLAGFNKPGLYAGVYASYDIYPEQALQLEISFIQKGSRKTPNPDVGDFNTYLLNFNYVEIPVWYRYKPIDRVGVEGSLSWAYMFNYREEDHNGPITMPPTAPRFSKYDISSGIGLFYMMSENLMINMRMTHSILPVRKHASGASYYLNFGQYHHVLMFSFHYQFSRAE